MGKKGSSQPAVTKSEVTQSTLPEYARPYYENLLKTGEGLTLGADYTPYGGQRIADFTPQQLQVQQEIGGMTTPGQFQAGSQMAAQAGLASMQAGQYDPSQFTAQTVTPEQLQYFQMGGPQQFGSEQAQQYMSPYVQNVLEIQKREALRDAQRGQLAQDLGAARQGTFGGSRQLMAAMMRERNLGEQMGDIQARGLQSAYEAAMGQFNTEQGLRQQAGAENLRAALGVQDLGARNAIQAALANQQYGLEAQRLGEMSRQFGAQQGLAGLAQSLQAAQTLGTLGQQQQAGDLSRLTAQQQAAAQQQALNQEYLDTAYEDFMRQRDYPLEMLQQYSSILRGVPVTPQSTTTTYAPKPSVAQQLLGGGLGALGMYKSLAG